MARLIGNGVIITDDVEEQGFDFVGLKMAGQLKAPAQVAGQDLLLGEGTKYIPPGGESDLEISTDLSATAEGTTSVTLAIEAQKGETPYTYQWYKDDAVISGATSSTYAATASGTYKAVVSDASGTSVTSTACTVTVYSALAFTTNLASSHSDVYLSNSETFGPLTVAVSGGKTPYTYQWKRSSSNVGSSTPTFGPSNVDDVFPTNGTYNWSCVVTDALGNSITSTVMPVSSYRLPSFATQPPATLSVAAGAAISIAAAAATTSKPARTYQWYKDSAAISGATSATYAKTAAVAGDAGTYYVIVTDANGKTAQSSNCVLTVTS